MKERHNMTVQGQRNTAVGRGLQERADQEMAKWRRQQRADGSAVPDLPPKEPLRFEGKGHRRRLKRVQRNEGI